MTQAVSVGSKVVGKIHGLRWYICALLFFVTFINYVDRVSLGAMAPTLKKAIGWDDAEFGWINFAFQFSYAAMFPFAGRFLDRVGVRGGLAIGVLVWSAAAMAHSLATSVLGFAMARFVLGLGEATNFPACVKAVAEWFPKRQRSLATGIFNTGTNFGAMLQGSMMWLSVVWGWQSAFIAIGLLGVVWLFFWMKGYRSPEEHPRLSTEEAELIRSDQEPPAKSLHVPWQSLLRYREAWAFCVGKMLTDPVWWFYLTWLPSYLQGERNFKLSAVAGALFVIYLSADIGSIFGGWLPGYFMRRGWHPSRARLVTMILFAMGLPISAFGVMAKDLWSAVFFISIATSCHQAWSANLFTTASDAFPKKAVASVVGLGGMCGGIGGMLMVLVSGGMKQWLGTFVPLFIFAGVMHPLAWIAIRSLVGSKIQEIDLDKGLRTAQSPALLFGGLGLTAVGAGLAVLVFANWAYILSVTKNSTAAAAGGAAAASLIACIGLALAYASREVRLSASSAAS
jgi:ACS family hexuronate transporter-like MFS transporter